MIKEFNFRSQKVEIELKNLSFIKELPQLLGKPHKVTFYQLLWLQLGKAVHRVDFQEIEMLAGDILVIVPGQVCEFDTQSDYQGRMIIFTKDFFSVSDFDTHFLHTSQILSISIQNDKLAVCPILISNMIEVLEEEMQTEPDQYQATISQSILRVILLEMERSSNKLYPKNKVANDFFIAVEDHFKDHKNIEFYTDLLVIGEKTLLKEIKDLTSETPKTYINKRLILEAKRLLVYSSLSIKEIGYSLGFEEPANFNNFFKKHVLFTPVQFRTKSEI